MSDERAVSVTVNYAMNLAIATVLIAGLMTVTADLVEDRRESATRAELSVVGNRVTADLMSADRLAQASDDSEVRIETRLPSRVAGSHYSISIDATPADPHVTLEPVGSSVAVTVPFRNATAIRNGTVTGGDLAIVLADDGRLEVRA